MLALEVDGLDSVAADLILHRAAGHTETTSLSQQAIEVDLYKQTLHQAKVLCLQAVLSSDCTAS